MTFLVDANVLSEPTRPAPEPRVIDWLVAHERDLAVNPVVLGEIRYGILLLPAGARRRRLEQWFKKGVERIVCLDWTADTGATWAQLLAHLKRTGTPIPVKDSLVAATALEHRLTVVTRNTRDFFKTGVKILDPFQRGA